jgi:hypothetical protein
MLLLWLSAKTGAFLQLTAAWHARHMLFVAQERWSLV